ncbi:hypothetical protein [Robinsoniella peoriensis]|uniref:hypothetical protein n=1 Tax=Robinsoniella peoriensis TaxID=180332 RepID=UPI00363C2611
MNSQSIMQPNETPKAYRIRLYKNKELYGLSNIEIGKLCNEAFGVNWDESAHRKKTTNYIKGYNDAKSELGSVDFQLQELVRQNENIEKNIRKERYKLQATKLERDRLEKTESRFELFYENIKDAITTLPLPDIKPYKLNKVSDDEYIVLIADVHFGAKFKSIHNEYSIDIVQERFKQLLTELVLLIEERHISKITVLGLGDDVQGIIHLTDFMINQIPVVDAVVQYPRIVAQFLNELSVYCFVEYYSVMNSNHTQTRPLGTKASEIATEDVEKIIVNHIYDLVAVNERVVVHTEFSNKPVELDIKGFKIIAQHGHQVKAIGDNVLKDLSDFYKVFYNYAILGHLHAGKESVVGSSGSINNKVIVADGFEGSCPYSDTILKDCRGSVKILKFTDKGYTGHETVVF